MGNGILKEPYCQIEANDAEMARFRAEFARRLPVRKGRPSLVKILVPAAATAVALILLVLRDHSPDFAQLELDELEALAATASPDIVEKAQVLATRGEGLDGLNACVVLCLVEPVDQAAPCIAKGLENDPRPEIRAFYLEQLLERADECQFNLDMIEELWDQETDEQCQRLYKDLFRIAA